MREKEVCSHIVRRVDSGTPKESMLSIGEGSNTILVVFPSQYDNSSFADEAIASADVFSLSPNNKYTGKEMHKIASEAIRSLWN